MMHVEQLLLSSQSVEVDEVVSSLSWGEKTIIRDRIAEALAERLPKKVGTGAVYAKSSAEWSLCREVCFIMGLRFAPINSLMEFEEILNMLRELDADVVFFGKEYAETVAGVQKGTAKNIVWVCLDGDVEGALSLAILLESTPEATHHGTRSPRNSRSKPISNVLNRIRARLPGNLRVQDKNDRGRSQHLNSEDVTPTFIAPSV
mmetsp:Transcript_28829/g.76004  ORF Transcript_28829/g.76004 Transcript_28829/m.76004 type:complete len:204 (-) Transcript_28829:59-670(-)